MLATPARIAGCKKVVLCSPPPIADEILYAAQLCGVQDVFNVGGAQAIAALAFGTESVPKVDKIFGPETPLSPRQNAGKPASGRCGDRYARRPVGSVGHCRQRRNAGFRGF